MFELSVFLKERLVGRTTFDQDEVRIGRSADNEVQVDNLAFSRYHASIERLGDLFVLRDFGTLNGTFLNGERVAGRATLDDGDRVGVGKFTLVFRCDQKGGASAEKPAIRDRAAYAVAGATMVGPQGDVVRERTCPFVGFLELEGPGGATLHHALSRDITVVGSRSGCDLVLETSPPRAAAIVRSWHGFVLVALAQPVAVAGRTVETGVALANGAELVLGEARARFRVGRPGAAS